MVRSKVQPEENEMVGNEKGSRKMLDLKQCKRASCKLYAECWCCHKVLPLQCYVTLENCQSNCK